MTKKITLRLTCLLVFCCILFQASAQRKFLKQKPSLVSRLIHNPFINTHNRISALLSLPGNSQDYQVANGAWALQTNSAFSYNTAGKLTQRLYTNAATGQPFLQEIYVYNNQQHLTEYRQEEWNGNGWGIKTGYRGIYTPDSAGKIINTIIEVWMNNSWMNYDRIVTTYNQAGLPESDTWFTWNGSAWNPVVKDIYTYQSGVISEIVSQSYNSFTLAWQDAERRNNLSWHIPNQELSGFTHQQVMNGNWEDKTRYNAVYNLATGSYTGLFEAFWNGIWENAYRYTYSCDAWQNYIGSKSEKWMSNAWFLEWEDQEILTYLNNDITERVFRDSKNQTGIVQNRAREVYSNFQHITVNGNQEKLTGGGVSVYPNPATDIVTVKLENRSEAMIQLADLSGRIAQTEILRNGVGNLNIKELPAGIYVLRIQTEKRIHTSRIVKH